MYLQFLDLYGNPVYVPPSPLPALRGLAVMWEGKPRAATLIVLPNRETFRVRGHVDTIKDAIVEWHAEKALTPHERIGRLIEERQAMRAERLADQPVAASDISDDRSFGTTADQPVSPSDDQFLRTGRPTPRDCPLVKCDSPGHCATQVGGCKVVAAERRAAPADSDNTL